MRAPTCAAAVPLVLAGGLLAAGSVGTAPAETSWLQFGGPNRNFTVPAVGLATKWPASGPKKLWERSLGEGHSSIVAEGGRLYTMYRPAGPPKEVVAAIDAATGKTIWEHAYDAPASGLDFSEGAGPHSTPLISGDRLFAASSRSHLFALDKQTGKVLWSHDLVKEFGATQADRGYAPSPLLHRDTVIVSGGGSGSAVVAFNQQTGAVVWKGGSFSSAPASPLLIAVDGQEQLVVPGGDETIGMNPSNGTVLWTHPNKTEWGLNISMPVWADGNRLFTSAAYSNGSRLLRLSQKGGKTAVKELWYQNRMRVHIGSVIRIGDFAVGASGDFGPCPTVAIDLASGSILWQDRQFARSTFVYAGDKLIIMDEDGNLGLAAPTRTGLNVLAKTPVLTNRAWTTPTLVGTTLYVRDRAKMMAFDLGR